MNPIEYSPRYTDGNYEFRHITLPQHLVETLPSGSLTEEQWRGLGVQQGRGWENYTAFRPEPSVLLFRRRMGTDPTTGEVDPEAERAAKSKYAEALELNRR